jgi:hypothetical protein
MELDPASVKELMQKRLPFSDAITPAELHSFALDIVNLVNQGDNAEDIALQLSRIHTNKLD